MSDTPPEQDRVAPEFLLESSSSESTASGTRNAHQKTAPHERVDRDKPFKLFERRGSGDYRMMPKFDGENYSPKTWMEIYESTCEYNDWTTDVQKVSRLANHLTAGPRKWYENNIIEHGDDEWELWKENFLFEFEPYKLQAAQEALSLQFAGNVIIYMARKEVLLDRAFGDLTDEQFQTLMMLGMPQHMIRYIENHNPRDREHFMSIARSYSRAQPPMSGQFFPYQVEVYPADESSCNMTSFVDEDEEDYDENTGYDDGDEATHPEYGAEEEDDFPSDKNNDYGDADPGYYYYQSDEDYAEEATGGQADGARGGSYSDDW